MKLGHAHLKVRSLEPALAFYTGILGLRVTERIGDDFVFLSFGAAHHDLALQAIGKNAVTPPRHATGLFHLAFEVHTDAELAALVAKLQAAGLPAHGVDYGISRAVYTQDPDGNGVEFYRDTRTESGKPLWHGDTAPLRL